MTEANSTHTDYNLRTSKTHNSHLENFIKDQEDFFQPKDSTSGGGNMM